jgi:hypothetical protein
MHSWLSFMRKVLAFGFMQTIDETMCEDTVFWDLNYSIQYKSLGVGDTMSKVLKVSFLKFFKYFFLK